MNEWLRVSKKHPCIICGRSDWDTYTSDGNYACCMRIMDGAIRELKNGGYLFRLTSNNKTSLPRQEFKPLTEYKNFGPLVYENECKTSERQLNVYAQTIQLPGWPLRLMRCGFYQGTIGFPMYDHTKKIIGIRLRTVNGQKWCIPGSKNGLFLGDTTNPDMDLEYGFIVEGSTNVAALMSIGIKSVGRPSNTAGLDMLIQYLKPTKRLLVICRDNDTKPEALKNTLRGAWLLAKALILRKKQVKMIVTPTKDSRDWVWAGKSAPLMLAHNAKTLNIDDCNKNLSEILPMTEKIMT